MNRSLLSTAALALAALLGASCSSGPAPEKKAATKKPAEPASGQSGLFQMFQVARAWAPDVQLLKLSNGDLPGVKSADGKYGVWSATLASLTKKQKRDFTYAVADGEGIFKGARGGAEAPFIETTRGPRPIPVAQVKIDTPAALETAQKEIAKDKSMQKVLDENKDLPVQFLLEWDRTQKNPNWRVIYGTSVSQSKFSILIDATTGEFVKKLR